MERHEAIVVGAGPAGLASAAMLAERDFGVLVLERGDAPGARWRERYDGLRLNTMSALSALPGHRIPRVAGRYPIREDFITYLEAYARHHRLSVRPGTSLEYVERDDASGLWQLETTGGPLLARYVVIATGHDAVPVLPDWPGRESFAGELIHARDYRDADPYRDRAVLIVGAGVSGVELAGKLDAVGADVTVSVRTPPNIFPRDWLGIPLQPMGVMTEWLPARLQDAFGYVMQRVIWGDLTQYGIPRPPGFATTFRRTLHTFSIDDGFVAALKAGRVRMVGPIERFEGAEIVLGDGMRLAPDAVICATGYRSELEPLVGHLNVLRADGIPLCHDGAPEHPMAPRLYFVGFWRSTSGQLRLMRVHAKRVAQAAAKDRARERRAL